uniref:Putative early growth response protein n=1 Tax=Renibacterium salmoninarum TaxID=1646 RepID=Q8KHY2_RENSA|nr:putative early growth response protein [Renibacterium salmoninarum]AAM47188.1 putative early growth response protein [Renibacterium salmoninarum]
MSESSPATAKRLPKSPPMTAACSLSTKSGAAATAIRAVATASSKSGAAATAIRAVATASSIRPAPHCKMAKLFAIETIASVLSFCWAELSSSRSSSSCSVG